MSCFYRQKWRDAEAVSEEEEKCDLCVTWCVDLAERDGSITAQNALRQAQGGIRPPLVGVMPEAGVEPVSWDQTIPKSTQADTQENPESAPYQPIGGRSTEDATQPIVSASEGVPPVSRVNFVSISDLPPELQAVIEAWPKMPEVIRSAIMGMLESIENSQQEILPCSARPLVTILGYIAHNVSRRKEHGQASGRCGPPLNEATGERHGA